jgi:predicted site-specific integrase-resolvase
MLRAVARRLPTLTRVAKRISIKDEIVTIAQAAEILGVSAVTLRRWDASGKLIARRHPMSGYRIYRMRDMEKLRRMILDQAVS